jgi:integrase
MFFHRWIRRNKANLPAGMNVNAHALRHRFAQNMLDDFDARTVSQWMGIEVDTLLQVYAYRSENDLMRKRFGEIHPPTGSQNCAPRDNKCPGQSYPVPNNFLVVVYYN